MGYIALMIAILIGGAVALNQGFGDENPLVTGGSTDLSVPIEAAKEAVATLETRSEEMVTADEDGLSQNTGSAVSAPRLETMMVAGGCFWCVEADLEKLPGVIKVVSGYAGGSTESPNYQNYASGGHKEVVEVTYDATKVSFEEVLIFAMKHMDPTDDDGSFGDRGEYYSPAFYYKNPAEKAVIENLITEVDTKGPYEKPLAIDVEAASTFFAAEDYHQDYYKGTVSKLKYQYYRTASGRDAYIKKIWGSDTGATLSWRAAGTPVTKSATINDVSGSQNTKPMWNNYTKPNNDVLKAQLDPLVFKVTQEEGTERAGTSPLDKNYERGIYVDILSGEPLFSSKDKFDSGTGWPSFVKPISDDAVTEHVDKSFFSTRTEIRSRIADNHLGHVFSDGPQDRGGLRYCMNGVALRFVPEREMAAAGYGDFLGTL